MGYTLFLFHMPAYYSNQQESEPEQFAEAASLYKELRMMRGQLQMEEQQALVTNDSTKINTVRLALKTSCGKTTANTVIQALDEVSKGLLGPAANEGAPGAGQCTMGSELLAAANDIKKEWSDLLRTYKSA